MDWFDKHNATVVTLIVTGKLPQAVRHPSPRLRLPLFQQHSRVVHRFVRQEHGLRRRMMFGDDVWCLLSAGQEVRIGVLLGKTGYADIVIGHAMQLAKVRAIFSFP